MMALFLCTAAPAIALSCYSKLLCVSAKLYYCALLFYQYSSLYFVQIVVMLTEGNRGCTACMGCCFFFPTHSVVFTVYQYLN